MKHISRQEILRIQHEASGSERLSALAAFVETLRPREVTLTWWYQGGTGCVVGLAAATDPWFRAQGLRLADPDAPQLCRPVYRDRTDWDAVAAFFDLDRSTCRRLFSADGYDGDIRPSPTLIAAHIRRHLAQDRRGGRTAYPG